MRVIKTPYPLTAADREQILEACRNLCPEADPGEICFLDIETTGFSRTYSSIYLMGYAVLQDADHLTTVQFLASDLKDEAAVLEQSLESLMQYRYVVTYNGDMFDLPFIRERAMRLRVFSPEISAWFSSMISLDLMRRYKKYQSFFHWSNMKLKSVEACLGAVREDPFSGGELIEVFDEYSQNPDERLEKTLLLHNYEDIVNLLSLLKVERLIGQLRCGRPLEIRLQENTLQILWDRALSLSLETEVPIYHAKKKDPLPPQLKLTLEAGACLFSLELPAAGSSGLKYYLPHPEDYYYLPETQEIVHRSLADGIPASGRKKAKAEQCFLPAPDGDYLACPPVSPAVLTAAPQQGSAAGTAIGTVAANASAKPPAAASLKAYHRDPKDPAAFYRLEDFASWLAAAEAEEVSAAISSWLEQILS